MKKGDYVGGMEVQPLGGGTVMILGGDADGQLGLHLGAQRDDLHPDLPAGAVAARTEQRRRIGLGASHVVRCQQVRSRHALRWELANQQKKM